jgi:FMN reductase
MTTTAPVVDAGPAAHPAGAALRVVVVNGSPSQSSKTMGLVDVILDTLAGMLPVQTSRINGYRLGPGFTGAIERDDVTPEVEAALRLAEEADLLLAATPVFSASYPGMFKHFFDQYALPTSPSCWSGQAEANTMRSPWSTPCGPCSPSSRR